MHFFEAVQALKGGVYCLLPKPNKVVWDTQLSDKFKFILELPDCKESFQNFINTGIMQTKAVLTQLTNLFQMYC